MNRLTLVVPEGRRAASNVRGDEIVIAASIIGWTQIKKLNELAAAYTMAAHEIGLIRSMSDSVSTDAEFSGFVNDAEKAFSREHTLWIARQSD